MKYRIKKEITKGGDIKYWPQEKSFLFWIDIDKNGTNYPGRGEHPVACYSMKEAMQHIDASKRVLKAIEDRRISKIEMINVD